MKLNELKSGDYVVMNDLPDAELYMAGGIVGHQVELITVNYAKARNIGMFDVSLIQHANNEQLGER